MMQKRFYPVLTTAILDPSPRIRHLRSYDIYKTLENIQKFLKIAKSEVTINEKLLQGI